MQIEEFLKSSQKWEMRNAWLTESEWEGLYVRRGVVAVTVLETGKYVVADSALHLASFEARVPRTGAFTRLVSRIEKAAPGLPIYVENMFDQKFAEKLIEAGFEEVCISYPPEPWKARCFLKRY